MEYLCDRCRKTFSRKSNYERHVNRKFPCVQNKPDTEKKKHVFLCNRCNKKYSNQWNLDRHLNTSCKPCDTLVTDSNIKKVVENLLKQVDELKKTNAELNEKFNKLNLL